MACTSRDRMPPRMAFSGAKQGNVAATAGLAEQEWWRLMHDVPSRCAVAGAVFWSSQHMCPMLHVQAEKLLQILKLLPSFCATGRRTMVVCYLHTNIAETAALEGRAAALIKQGVAASLLTRDQLQDVEPNLSLPPLGAALHVAGDAQLVIPSPRAFQVQAYTPSHQFDCRKHPVHQIRRPGLVGAFQVAYESCSKATEASAASASRKRV